MKQGKVSMVVPCYNKVGFIDMMLDSVIAQEWDNIELILVNDGSTDGTREVISAYEPRLKARGYDVVIIDQENAGCCAAVYAGLLRMTGDYFCLVDCDDAIEPKYVSHMAGWLDTNNDCEWAACSYRTVRHERHETQTGPMKEYRFRQDTDNLLEKYILRETITTVWVYMTRVSYINKCAMIENFCTERRKTYEPLIMVPLAFGMGKLEHFNEPLYLYNQTALDLFKFTEFDKCVKYYDDYMYLYDWAISRLSAPEAQKRRLFSIARLAYFKEIVLFMPRISDGMAHEQEIARLFAETLDELFEPTPAISAEDILRVGFALIFKIMQRSILNELPPKRIIGYGALGKSAGKLLPLLEKSAWRPTELWDMNGDGVNVKKPDFNSLAREDIILLLPTKRSVLDEFAMDSEGCRAKVLERSEINEIIAEAEFSRLAEARLKH